MEDKILKTYIQKNAKDIIKKMSQTPIIDMVATGINIAKLREKAGLSVRDLQEIFGFATPQAIYKWQHGSNMPTIDNLVVLSAIFEVGIDEIVVVNGNCKTMVGA